MIFSPFIESLIQWINDSILILSLGGPVASPFTI